MIEPIVLNGGPVPSTKDGLDIAAELRKDMNRLKGEFIDLEQGKLDYGAMRSSEAYREYASHASLLREFPLSALASREEQLAFWINIYNILVIHGIIELGIKESVRELNNFFRKFSYVIGGSAYTPDDVEHGVLRSNRRPPYRLLLQFSPSDIRILHIIRPPDPRIHFTLVCGSSSCPPINYYHPDKIYEQMDLATAGFINGPEVEILPARNLIRLSPIFKWYSRDFGGRKGIVDFLAKYRENGKERDFLLGPGTGARIAWKKYDWSLNR